jgi:hypothetical protein
LWFCALTADIAEDMESNDCSYWDNSKSVIGANVDAGISVPVEGN